MPNLTPNYNLKKPIKATENADIDVLNENMDTLDIELKNVSNKANSKEIIVKNITINKENYTTVYFEDVTKAWFRYYYEDLEIKSTDVVDINFTDSDIINGYASDLLSVTSSLNSKVYFYSEKKLNKNLNATMIIQKGV